MNMDNMDMSEPETTNTDMEMGGMQMYMRWNTKVTFLIKQWNTGESEGVKFAFGCILCILISIVYALLPVLKKKVVKKLSGKDKVYSCVTRLFMLRLYLVDCVFFYAIHLLIMTFNGYVMTGCILGLTIGYTMTSMKKDFSNTMKEASSGKVEDLKEYTN